MKKTTKMLALGHEQWTHTVRVALSHMQKNGFVGVNNFWNLCVLPEPVSADVAILHPSFPEDDVRCAAQYIRRRWPGAMILVIGDRANLLDDPLYDDKASGEISPEELVWQIEELMADRRGIRKDFRLGLGGARG